MLRWQQVLAACMRSLVFRGIGYAFRWGLVDGYDAGSVRVGKVHPSYFSPARSVTCYK